MPNKAETVSHPLALWVISYAERFTLPVALFLFVWPALYSNGLHLSIDSRWTIQTAVSLLREGNTDLEEYRAIIDVENDYRIQQVGGRLYPVFPIGTALIALPFIFILQYIVGYDLYSIAGQTVLIENVEALIASCLVALATVVMFVIARRSLKNTQALLVALVFSFGTSAWSTASQALWQHGPSMLLLAIALYIFILAEKRPSLVQFAGLPLAFSYIIRPTNSLSIVILTLLVLIRYRRYVWGYLFGAALIAAPFMVYNLHLYDSLFSPYYRPGRLGNHAYSEALLGNLISPSRGLFAFTPVFLFSVAGIFIKLKEDWRPLDTAIVLIIVLHWSSISLFPQWWAGHSFGPRLFTDIVPYLTYFLIPMVRQFVPVKENWRSFYLLAFIGLALLSGIIHFRGATHFSTWVWNTDPVNVDQRPDRVWDWQDPQFLR